MNSWSFLDHITRRWCFNDHKIHQQVMRWSENNKQDKSNGLYWRSIKPIKIDRVFNIYLVINFMLMRPRKNVIFALVLKSIRILLNSKFLACNVTMNASWCPKSIPFKSASEKDIPLSTCWSHVTNLGSRDNLYMWHRCSARLICPYLYLQDSESFTGATCITVILQSDVDSRLMCLLLWGSLLIRHILL